MSRGIEGVSISCVDEVKKYQRLQKNDQKKHCTSKEIGFVDNENQPPKNENRQKCYPRKAARNNVS